MAEKWWNFIKAYEFRCVNKTTQQCAALYASYMLVKQCDDYDNILRAQTQYCGKQTKYINNLNALVG